jgi:hypothetical protein
LQRTYNILVGIHEDVETIVFGNAQYAYCVLDKGLVVLSRPLMLDGLPCEDIPYGVVPPGSQPCEVSGGIIQGKGSVHKRNIVAVEEVLRDMGRDVRRGREFGIGGAVDAML